MGATEEFAQLEPPQRSPTQTERPSLSMSMALTPPHVRPAGQPSPIVRRSIWVRYLGRRRRRDLREGGSAEERESQGDERAFSHHWFLEN